MSTKNISSGTRFDVERELTGWQVDRLGHECSHRSAQVPAAQHMLMHTLSLRDRPGSAIPPSYLGPNPSVYSL